MDPKRGRPKEHSPMPVYKTAPALSEIDSDKFARLPEWQRNLVGRLVETGDLDKAAKETGVSRYVKDVVDTKLPRLNTIKAALAAGGITAGEIVRHLKECLEGKTTRYDHHGNAFTTVDHRLKLSSIKLICALRGDFDEIGPENKKTKDIMEMFKIEEQDK